MLPDHLGEDHPLVLDAGSQAVLQRHQADGLAEHSQVKHRPGALFQGAVQGDDQGCRRIEVAEAPLKSFRALFLVFPLDLYELKELLGQLRIPL